MDTIYIILILGTPPPQKIRYPKEASVGNQQCSMFCYSKGLMLHGYNGSLCWSANPHRSIPKTPRTIWGFPGEDFGFGGYKVWDPIFEGPTALGTL